MADAKVLMQRIAQGRAWLLDNENNPHYAEGLERYEKLVDEAATLGIKETDCWLTDKEQDELFLGKTPKQETLVSP